MGSSEELKEDGRKSMIDIHELGVIPISKMRGEDDDETHLLWLMLGEARAFLKSFPWCHGIREEYFGFGIGGVVAVFLFRISAAVDVDEWLWAVCGDLPSAYLVIDRAHHPSAALAAYCDLMEDWILAVRGNEKNVDQVFPVSAPRTLHNAELLDRRIRFLRENIMPLYDSNIH